MRKIWTLLKTAVTDFVADGAMTHAAGIAFYTALSFAPLITLLISVGGWLGPDTQQSLVGEVERVIGEQAAGVVDTIVENARNQGGGTLAFWLSLAVALFSASGVFAQLQNALNQVWDVKAKPGQGVWGWVRTRVLSIGVVAGIIFILLASLAVSAAIDYLLPASDGWGRIGSIVISLIVYIPMFMLLFKLLPDVKIAWADVLFGSVVTALLFMIGKALIGLYLGHSAVGSAYGAAGSLVVLLVWVYYSAIILLFGVELTQTRARLFGHGIQPDEHAVRDDQPHKRPDTPPDQG
jgi:membrane protein